MSWQSTGIAASTVRPGTKREVLVDGRSLVLFRLSDGFFAVDGTCPHLGGILADGTLEADVLTCPEHGAQFEVRTGAVRADPDGVVPPSGEIAPLQRYAVREASGLLEIDA